MENKREKPTYRESWAYNTRAWKIWWKKCPGLFISQMLKSVLKAVTPYITIYLSAQIISELAGNRDPKELFKWVLIQLISAGILALLSGILTRWSNYEQESGEWANSRIYMDKTLDLDYADIDRQYVSDLYFQIAQNAQWSGWGLYKTLRYFEQLITSAVQMIGGIALSVSLFVIKIPQGYSLAFLNNPVFAALIIAFMLVIALVSPACSNKGDSYWAKWAPEAKFGNRFFGFFGFMANDRKRAVDLRMYCQQEKICDFYLNKNIDLKDNDFVNASLIRYAKGPMGLWRALSQCLIMVLTGVVYLFVCLKAWAGAFGVGSVTQYVGAITQLFLGISDFLKTIGDIRLNGEFLETAYEYLDLPNNMYQGCLTTEKRSDRQYSVEFKDVSFKYPGTDQWALRHVNLKFKVGSRLAVVGMNGSGKTTFIKLLCRLYDPTEGQILLNGIDIRKYRYDDYINIFSVVFQDFKLMALPLGENVAGSSSYDREKVQRCLADAGFEGRVSRMPKSLDTYLYKELDNDGVEVSGGEAQKIAIARALYKDAPFIILDEPTAALDPIAEAEIYEKFDGIAGDKTAIYISHRLSSCKFCDEIAVFDHGAIIQQGTHADLLSDTSGKYAELWNAQAQYYTE